MNEIQITTDPMPNVNGVVLLFEESDNHAAFFPNKKRHSTEGAVIISNRTKSGPFEELISLPNRLTLYETFGEIADDDSGLKYADHVLTFSYGGGLYFYRTNKGMFAALHDIANSNYEDAEQLKKILKDVGV